MAAALTVYDDDPEIVEEARYGELVFEYYGWGHDVMFGNIKEELTVLSVKIQNQNRNRM